MKIFTKIRIFAIAALICVPFISSNAAAMCIDGFVEDGGVSNLEAKTACVVDQNQDFMWNAYKVSAAGLDDYSVVIPNSGNDDINEVAGVIGFLTDFGFTVTDNTAEFYSNDGESVGMIGLLGKSDEGYGNVLPPGEEVLSGTWALPDDDVAIFVTIKAANSFSLIYLPDGADGGNWNTDGLLNNGGQQPGVSHISFWYADAGFGILCIDCCEDGDDCEPVPEPNVLVLLSLTLFGVVIYNRRKWLKQ